MENTCGGGNGARKLLGRCWSLAGQRLRLVLRQEAVAEGAEPEAVLQHLGYTGDERIALFPPVLLDDISTDLLLPG